MLSSRRFDPGLQVEAWLTAFRAESIASLDEAAFEEYKAAVARNLDEPPRTLHQEASALWPEILEGTHRCGGPCFSALPSRHSTPSLDTFGPSRARRQPTSPHV